MSEQLKACPFCGINKPLVYRNHEKCGPAGDEQAVFIDCSGCNNIDMGPFESNEHAREVWNTRVPEEALLAERDALIRDCNSLVVRRDGAEERCRLWSEALERTKAERDKAVSDREHMLAQVRKMEAHCSEAWALADERKSFRDDYLAKHDSAVWKCKELTAERDALRGALERISDKRMWRSRMGELIWEGESPDGNLIETADPLQIARAALAPTREEAT